MEARASNGGISITRNRSSPSPSTERYMGLFSRSQPENANGGSVLSATDVGDDLDEDEVFWTGDFSQSTHRSNPPTAGVVNRNHQPLGFRRTENFGILAALPEEDKRKKEDEETLGDVPVMVKIGTSRSIPRPQSPGKKRDYSLSLPSGKLTQSAPVNVPVLSKAAAAARAKRHTVVEEEDEDDDDQEILPPHEIVARASASRSPWTTFSVLEGVGRTLKGRDLRQVRNAVWRQTGFLD